MAWIGNKSRPISFLRNETLFTTVSTSMMSTEIYFDDGIRKFARRTTKVDEGDGGEERLIETSANRSYVLCSDVCCAIHVSSLFRSLYNAPRFDHSSFFNKFLDQRYNETYSSPNLRYYFYLSNFLHRVRIEAENSIPNFAIIPFQLFHETVWTFLDTHTPFYLYLYKLLVEIRKTFAIARRH